MLRESGSSRFWCNGTPVQPGCPVRVFPGQSNSLSVEWHPPPGNVIVRVDVIAPDGRTQARTSSLTDGRAELELGSLCAPAQYEYENGIVFRRGYSCRISVENPDSGEILARYDLAAVCSRDVDAEWLLAGAPARCVYNDGFFTEGRWWYPFGKSAGAMQPPLQLRLDPAVLADQDRVTVCYRTRPEPAVAPMRARLRIRDEEGNDMISPCSVEARDEWQEISPDAAAWPQGTYSVELQPVTGDTVWEDGPRVMYRREAADPGRVRVSPYAPFSLRRDATREEIEITDWPASLPDGWETAEHDGSDVLFCNGDPSALPVALDPKAEGTYAVFVQAVNSAYVRAGRDEIVRRVDEPEIPVFGDVFVTAADLSGRNIELLPNALESLRQALGEARATSPRMKALVGKFGGGDGEIRSGVRRIRLVPVTESSVRELRESAGEPAYELRGVDDWWDYFRGWDRTDPDQLDAMLRGQRELGIKTLNWAVGRSWVEYPTRLPDAQVFPCAPITASLLESGNPAFQNFRKICEACDPLAYSLERRAQYDVRIQGWLAMNRHYSPEAYGGVFTSPWARAHQRFCQSLKDDMKKVDVSRMEYFFPEVRGERLDILEEVAGYGPDGIVIGCCRQPPMAGYNPEMVAAYRERTGVDPTAIDIEDGQAYRDWIQWRAEFLTDMLHELHERLNVVRKKTGRRIPVAVRVPDAGFEWNLAQGMDVRAWVSEGLIQELQLDPLECAGGRASHDVRPYISLCRAYGVPVFGGVNGTTGAEAGMRPEDYSPVVGLRRAIGLLRAGVDGIEIYEAEVFARACERRWLIPLWGDPDRAEQWLETSNLEAVFPVTARNAALGHDNHWFGHETQTMHGAHNMPRGARRAL